MFFRSEVDAATGFFPIAVARRIGAFPTADFRRLFGLLVGVDGHFVSVILEHGESMPDTTPERMSTYVIEANRYNCRTMKIAEYSTIRVSGADAFAFLQAQLAGDLRLAADGEVQLSAWCNPKGRVFCLFRIRFTNDAYELALPTDLASEAMRRLAMYRFRSKVEFALDDTVAEQLGIGDSLADWRLDNLRSGIVEVGAAQSELFTPHMLNLDLLAAVSLDKGCYPGQEIVARTHYRGSTKRRCLRFESGRPLNPGDKVSDGTRDIGEIVNAIDTELLAVVPLDSADLDLTAQGSELRRLDLPYL